MAGTVDQTTAAAVPFRDLGRLWQACHGNLAGDRPGLPEKARDPVDTRGQAASCGRAVAAGARQTGRAMSNSNAGVAGGGAIYGLGIFGAWVFFWQQAETFWEYVLAVFQGLFWPALMVYDVFAALAG